MGGMKLDDLQTNISALIATGELRSNGKYNGAFRLLAGRQAADFFDGKEGISVSASPVPGEGLAIYGLQSVLGNRRWSDVQHQLNAASKAERGGPAG